MLFSNSNRKPIAAFLLLIFISQVFAPTVTYALTAGPTQPEATSFEPIDTTDMVNMQTGAFTYNMPLIEVPGPEGGYPLSLSYHAGIQPDLDASWVGLGWSLNPGAINRSVSGVPDDWRNITGSSRAYWNGGTSSTVGVGVNVGQAFGNTSVSFGLTFAHDTYKGFSVGYNFSAGSVSSVGMGDRLSQTVGFGVAPFTGKTSLTYGTNSSVNVVGDLNVSVGMGISTDFTNVQGDASVGVGLGSKGSLGASMSSSGAGGVSIGFGGASSSGPAFFHSSKDRGIQTSSTGASGSLPIPIVSGLSISLGFSKLRYWTDELATESALGSLSPDFIATGRALYDSYSLLDSPSLKSITSFPDPTLLQGGAYPDFDSYSVSGQGLSGSMRPYEFQGQVMGQNHKDASNNPIVTYNITPHFSHSLATGFRFINDFSNYFQQADNPYPDMSQDLTLIDPPFDASAQYGYHNGAINDGNKGVDNSKSSYGVNQIALAGSRNIEVDIDQDSKVLPSNIYGSGVPNRYAAGMIRGFSITNESGVTYHYDLPAYSYGEENYQEQISRANGTYFNRSLKSQGYAYTWYLTSITGPDFVDRDNSGTANDGDWGYWVNFEYGKWDNQYVWRNPSRGFTRDEDNNFQNCSMGYREVYYLNAIRTRTHIALFEKSPRYDAKGESQAIFDKNSPIQDYQHPYGLFDVNSSQSMQLSKIYILNIADANIVMPGSGGSSVYKPTATRTYSCSDCEQPAYTLDQSDIDAVGRSMVESKAIRIIDFNYDYSLCPNTQNSFDINNSSALKGKLTLLSVASRGKGGVSLLPPTKFFYDYSGSDVVSQTNATIIGPNGSIPANFVTSNPNFSKGDLVNAYYGGTTIFLGAITGSTFNGSTYTYNLINSGYGGGTPITATVQRTKNPPYNPDFLDSWGYYKSDADLNILASNPNLGRNTTDISSKSVDSWSLRKITSPLGDDVKINLESDTYNHSALNNTYSVVMQNLTALQPDKKTFNFTLANTSSLVNSSSMLQVGQHLTDLQLAVYVNSAAGGCEFVYTLTSAQLGGITISSINSGVVTGVLDQAIPSLYYGTDGTYLGFCTGNLWINSASDAYGGGVRVASITSTHSLENTSSSLIYSYNNNAGRSSGVTSYLPNILDAYDVAAVNQAQSISMCQLSGDINTYKAALYTKINSLYPIARELPPPGVLYEFVTVQNQQKNPDEINPRNIEGSTQYQFEVYKSNMVGREEVNTLQSVSQKYARNWIVRKFTSALGQVKRITQYDAGGRKLSETVNHYLHENLENSSLSFHDFFTKYKLLLQPYYNQGYIHERFAEVKSIPFLYYSPYETPTLGHTIIGGTRATLSSREEYPCILTGQTQINYVNGTQTSSTNLQFDFYSGAVTKSVKTDAYGNNVVSQTTPAYTIYPSMGLKIGNTANKNMLTQSAETYNWATDATSNYNPIGLLSANSTVWSDLVSAIDMNGTSYSQNTSTNGDVWRTQSSYTYMPTSQTASGTTLVANFVDFNFSSPSTSDPNWKKTNETTLYDVYSRALEAKDINSSYSAIRMNYGNKKVILTGGPANYYEMAYSGAEDAGVTQTNNLFIKAGTGTVTSVAGAAHTGASGLQLNAGAKGFIYSVNTSNLTAGRTYRACVWVKPVSGSTSNVNLYYDINGGTPVPSTASSTTSTKNADGWIQLNLIINGTSIVPGNTLNVYCRNDDPSIAVYTDDMRFQPLNSSTTAYVYDAFSGELVDILDNLNIYTRFEYDAVGRLVRTYKEKLGFSTYKSAEYQYNIGTYQSAGINQSYTKADCAVGNTGSTNTISVPIGMFTSSSSQQDADAQAQLYAQTQANTLGYCTTPVGINVPVGLSIVVLFKQGGVTQHSSSFGGSTSTQYYNVPVGTYDVEVVITAGSAHNINLNTNGTQFGTDVLFSGAAIQSGISISVF
jgi:hypothetical protein